jgi:hypothetical protein
MPIDQNTQISVTLNATQWNMILLQLAEGPYRVVQPLMIAIQQQCMAHENASEQSGAKVMPFNAAE